MTFPDAAILCWVFLLVHFTCFCICVRGFLNIACWEKSDHKKKKIKRKTRKKRRKQLALMHAMSLLLHNSRNKSVVRMKNQTIKNQTILNALFSCDDLIWGLWRNCLRLRACALLRVRADRALNCRLKQRLLFLPVFAWAVQVWKFSLKFFPVKL